MANPKGNIDVMEVTSRRWRDTRLIEQAAKHLNVTADQLPNALVRLLNEQGFMTAAQSLGISKGTLWSWLSRFKIQITKVAVREDEQRVVVVPKNSKVVLQ